MKGENANKLLPITAVRRRTPTNSQNGWRVTGPYIEWKSDLLKHHVSFSFLNLNVTRMMYFLIIFTQISEKLV